MKVMGNVSPEEMSMEAYQPKPGYVELRLRENVVDVSGVDKATGRAYTMYEYDEYTLLLKDKEGLREKIESNLSGWLTTGRTLDANGTVIR